MNKFYLIALMAILGGCATEYQKADVFSYGFNDTQLAENVFEVSFQGGEFDDAQRVRDFAMLRASEVTLERGFNYFKILGEDDQTEYSHYTTGGHTTNRYNAATNTTQAYTTRVRTHNSTEFGSTKRIMCYTEEPEGVFVYDAEFVANSIRNKYGIAPG